jgi:hypothetical protein
MREKLNSNPVAQIALIAVLLIAVGFFVMSSMGGGEEKSEGTASSEVSATVEEGVGALEPGTAVSASVPSVPMATSPPPATVIDAYESGNTVVLLFVHDGGIDDRLVRDASTRLAALPGVTTFVVPAARISRYAAITEGVGVERVPALVVIRPKRVNQAVPTASVSYGFQSGESVVQAVIDAGYEGPTVDYHP